MDKTNSNGHSMHSKPADGDTKNSLNPEQAVQILFSAVTCLMRSGLRVYAANVEGKLRIEVSGAQVDYSDNKARFLLSPDGVTSAEQANAPDVTVSAQV